MGKDRVLDFTDCIIVHMHLMVLTSALRLTSTPPSSSSSSLLFVGLAFLALGSNSSSESDFGIVINVAGKDFVVFDVDDR